VEFGVGQLATFSTFAGSVDTPSLETLYLKYKISFLQKLHLVSFKQRLAHCSL